jgi:D-beta-D-heptose 7-phosphate kinase/D-beta-D-heptose 1-phosphate adenosyltransferase
MSSSNPKPRKITALAGLLPVLARRKRTGKKIVFTNGCFDILHLGHTRYLQKARTLGDVLVIGMNTDSSVRKLKGPGRPVNVEKNRAEVLSALACVDFIVLFSELTPQKLIQAVKPDLLVKGGDWKIKDIAGAPFVISYGGKVKTIPFVKGFSTTGILKKISGL